MTRTRCRLFFWAMFAAYVAYLIGLASLGHLVTNDTLSIAVTEYRWYSLASAAIAIGCWIALGDGNGLIRLVLGAWGLVCLWIVWQTTIYTYALREPGQPG